MLETFFNASSKVRGSSRSINRDDPNWFASSSRFALRRDPTEKYASLLFRLVATSFPTCPVTPNTSRLLELFILISFVLVFSLPSNLDTARPLLKESSSSMNNAYMNQLSQKKISLDGV